MVKDISLLIFVLIVLCALTVGMSLGLFMGQNMNMPECKPMIIDDTPSCCGNSVLKCVGDVR